MRGTLPGLDTPYPLSDLLPAILQEDMLVTRLLSVFDELLAPIIGTLDCLYAYLDPRLAPPDFVEWLAAAWVGVELDENWPLERQRAIVGAAIELYRLRGTMTGLRTHLEIVSGGHVEIADNGGVSWSATPNGELPGQAVPRLAVSVHTADPEAVDLAAVDAVITANKPAHVAHRAELVHE